MRTNAFISLLIVAVLYQLANIAYFAAGGFLSASTLTYSRKPSLKLGHSLEDAIGEIDTSRRQLVLPECLWLQWRRPRPQFSHRPELIRKHQRPAHCPIANVGGDIHSLPAPVFFFSSFSQETQNSDISSERRQGVLPFPRFWASTRPFNTPLAPYFAKWAVTILMILAPPAGDAFNFGT